MYIYVFIYKNVNRYMYRFQGAVYYFLKEFLPSSKHIKIISRLKYRPQREQLYGKCSRKLAMLLYILL